MSSSASTTGNIASTNSATASSDPNPAPTSADPDPTRPAATDFRTTHHRTTDRHHLLWCRADWNHPYSQLLRVNRYLVPTIDRGFHSEIIHHNMIFVPPPPEPLCQQVFDQLVDALRDHKLDPRYDPIVKRLQFLIDRWENKAPRTVEFLVQQQKYFEEYDAYVAAHTGMSTPAQAVPPPEALTTAYALV